MCLENSKIIFTFSGNRNAAAASTGTPIESLRFGLTSTDDITIDQLATLTSETLATLNSDSKFKTDSGVSHSSGTSTMSTRKSRFPMKFKIKPMAP